ncbi:MAG: dentilisin complex subunit PrcA [Spirochaetaceae bacterium]|nr:dentilisin complex subunit PrcA [Spirochaetaceae bacterium]
MQKKLFSKAIAVLLCAYFATSFLGCPSNVTVVDPTSLNITGPDKCLWNNAGEDTFLLTWNVLPANADKSVRFTSSDSSICEVSDTGVLTARGEGTVTITGTTVRGGKTASVQVHVRDKELMIQSIDAMALDAAAYNGDYANGMLLSQRDFFFDREKNAFLLNPLEAIVGKPDGKMDLGMLGIVFDKEYLYKTSTTDFGASITTGTAGTTSAEFSAVFFSLNELDNKVTLSLEDPTTKDIANFDVIFLYDKHPEMPVWLFQNDNTQYNLVDFGTTQSGKLFFRAPIANSVDLTLRAKKWREAVYINGQSLGNKTEKQTYNFATVKNMSFSVKESDGTSTYPGDWNIAFAFQGKNPLLKSLNIEGLERFDFNPMVLDYGKPVALESNTNIKVTAIPEDETATVTINGIAVTKAGNYETNVNFATISEDTAITVVVRVGDATTETVTYTVPVQTAASTGVQFAIHVIDSIGGTKNLKDTTVDYKKSSDTGFTSVTVQTGTPKVISLEPNTLYDFIVKGDAVGTDNRFASSRLTNYFVDAREDQSLFLVQPKITQVQRKAEAPEVLEFGTIADISNISLTPITTPEFEINDGVQALYAVVHSPAGLIQYMEDSSPGIFMSFGEIPNLVNGIAGIEIRKDGDRTNGWTQIFVFRLDGARQLPIGKSDIIIVGYDVAMNRLEHRVYANYTKTHTNDTLEFAVFKNFSTTSMRVPGTIGYYSVKKPSFLLDDLALDPVDGKPTSYRVRVGFSLVENNVPVAITGYDIYRRKKGEMRWTRVTHKLYGSLSTAATHATIDSDSSLKENETYEYQVIAFNHNSQIKSPIIEGTVLESFTYTLVEPTAHKRLTVAQAKNQSYTVKFSNPKLLTNYVDYVNLGIVILDKDGYPRFASKVNYYPNGITPEIAKSTGIDYGQEDPNYTQPPAGTPAIGFGLSSYEGDLITLDYFLHWYKTNHEKNTDASHHPLLGLDRTADDFIKIDAVAGTVTFTPLVFGTSFYADETNGNLEPFCAFNIEPDGSQYGRPFTPVKGTTYQWDVVQFGSSTITISGDDSPIICGKYLTRDGFTSSATTYGSNVFANESTATNGRLEFTVIGD